MFTTVCISYRGAQGPPLVQHQEGEGLYRMYSPPYRLSYRGRCTPLKPRVQVPMGERWLKPSHCNPMRWCYGPSARKPWRPLRPSAMILRGSMTNVEEGHKSVARIEVATGTSLEVTTGPGWEVTQGSSQGTGLETIQEVK